MNASLTGAQWKQTPSHFEVFQKEWSNPNLPFSFFKQGSFAVTFLWEVFLFFLLLPCFKNILTWICADRPPCCYGNCRSVIWSIHLVCTSAASSSQGTPLSLPTSSKSEHACVSVRVHTTSSKSTARGMVYPSHFFFKILLFLVAFVSESEQEACFIEYFLKKPEGYSYITEAKPVQSLPLRK